MHDISFPPGRIAAFVAEGGASGSKVLSDVRINLFGHLGDGNIHCSLSPPVAAGFGGQAETLALGLARLADGMGGSFAAEHGLGRAKVGLADALRPAVERQMKAALKRTLDPVQRLNPGVIVQQD